MKDNFKTITTSNFRVVGYWDDSSSDIQHVSDHLADAKSPIFNFDSISDSNIDFDKVFEMEHVPIKPTNPPLQSPLLLPSDARLFKIDDPVLIDDNGRPIFTSQENEKQGSQDKHVSQMIFESKFITTQDLVVLNKKINGVKRESDDSKSEEKAGPFFINMVDEFKLHNRVIDRLNDQFESDRYEALKREANVLKHVS